MDTWYIDYEIDRALIPIA